MPLTYTSDVSRGGWVRERLSNWSTIAGTIPSGFEDYARVFHPVDARLHERDGEAAMTVIDTTITWAEVARRNGTIAHPLMQWNAILAGHRDPELGRPGWEFGEPRKGKLPARDLARIADTLARHTPAAVSSVAGLWEGFGWIHGGSAVARITLSSSTDADELTRIRQLDARPVPPAFSREVMSGPRLALPGRNYLLFTCELDDLRDPDRAERDGWQWEASPNILWPEDRAWFLASEIDLDSTLVGGSCALVDELLSIEGLEIARIPPDSSLQHDADMLNPLVETR